MLDNPAVLKSYQTYRVAESFLRLPEQILTSWTQAAELKLPARYLQSQNLVVCGMGGSNLASELLQAVYADEIKVPVSLVRDYNLPHFVSKQSLVVISSYSGNTEETLSCLKQALKKKAKLVVISTGGQAISLAKKHQVPYLQLDKKLNPSAAPRYALGLQLGAILSLLTNLKILKVKLKDIQQAVSYLDLLNHMYVPESDISQNIAKQVANSLENRLPVLVGADFLAANPHILVNQINESAKQLAVSYTLPELNHHLLEGLALPASLKPKLKFVFFNSSFYSIAIQKRFKITQKVLKKQEISYVDYLITSSDKLLTALEVLLFGSWLSYYLCVLNEQNPLTIPWVDYFKQELKK